MRRQVTHINNEKGFVLITGLLILMILTLLGLAATTNTSIELQIAGNDRLQKETLYQAEAGAITGTEVLENNFNCVTGFTLNPGSAGTTKWSNMNATIRAFERKADRGDAGSPDNSIAFWRNIDLNPVKNPSGYYIGIPAQADASYPIANLDPDGDGDPSDDLPETGYLYIAGETQMLPGGALQMAAGYEGKGKGAGAGGVAKIMDIYSQFSGALDSESIILFGWRHLVRATLEAKRNPLEILKKNCRYSLYAQHVHNKSGERYETVCTKYGEEPHYHVGSTCVLFRHYLCCYPGPGCLWQRTR